MVLQKGIRKGETAEVAPSPAKKRPKSRGECSSFERQLKLFRRCSIESAEAPRNKCRSTSKLQKWGNSCRISSLPTTSSKQMCLKLWCARETDFEHLKIFNNNENPALTGSGQG
ncbi:hypothetical protein NL676_018447 [Syzygium grande]|nr:hypothetical protein NL676_018447 [Syzygium grande]